MLSGMHTSAEFLRIMALYPKEPHCAPATEYILKCPARRLGAFFESYPPFSSSADDNKPSRPISLLDKHTFDWKTLDLVISKHHDTKTGLEDLMFLCLLPPLHMSLIEVRFRASVIKENFNRPDIKQLSVETSLYYGRDDLRLLIYDLEDESSSISNT